jgi:hypothetical protein
MTVKVLRAEGWKDRYACDFFGAQSLFFQSLDFLKPIRLTSLSGWEVLRSQSREGDFVAEAPARQLSANR